MTQMDEVAEAKRWSERSRGAKRQAQTGFIKIDYDRFQVPYGAAKQAACTALLAYIPQNESLNQARPLEDMFVNLNRHAVDGERSHYNRIMEDINAVADAVADCCIFENGPSIADVKKRLANLVSTYGNQKQLLINDEIGPLTDTLCDAAIKARDQAFDCIQKKQKREGRGA